MKCSGLGKRSRGLTLVEVFAIITIIACGVLLLLPALRKSKSGRPHINCASNLKQLGLAFRSWGDDNGDAHPMQALTNHTGGFLYADAINGYRYFQVMSNEINNPKVLTCPDDKTRTHATNFTSDFSGSHLSYFIGLDAVETMPQAFLTGDRNIAIAGNPGRGLMAIGTNQFVEWTKDLHNLAGNVGLGDGSVQEFSSSALRTAMQHTGYVTNRLLFP